jgi:predicted nucleic acid-binding protein
VPVFVDTNVLVYARDGADEDKHVRARAWVDHLWDSGEGRVSMQVLHEYYVTTTRKLRPGLPPAEARADVRDLSAWEPVILGVDGLETAWAVEERFGLSFWDALVVAAAQIGRCDVLLTEDLGAGMDIDGLRVVDPFQTAPPASPPERSS